MKNLLYFLCFKTENEVYQQSITFLSFVKINAKK